MGLDNLVGISLDKINPDASVIKRLISAAERNIADAHVLEISSENRFDVAYKAIMQLANAALQASGYRTLMNKPGHHMTMIQTLSQTVDLDNQTVIVLDALRKQRNMADALFPKLYQILIVPFTDTLVVEVKDIDIVQFTFGEMDKGGDIAL